MKHDENRDHIQSIERCMDVLLAFTDQSGHLGFTELSRMTGLSKPTVRRILLTLENLGFARSVGTRFALTPKVLGLGYAYLSSLDLPNAAQPHMEALTDRLKTSVVLSALDGFDVVYLSRVHRHRISSLALAVGTRLPSHATSSGHVLLADLSSESLQEYFAAGERQALTHRTITDEAPLRARLTEVRRRGWDIVDQELEIGRVSASVPVRDASGSVVAALSFSCESVKHGAQDVQANLLPELLSAGAAISAEIGGSSYAPSDAPA